MKNWMKILIGVVLFLMLTGMTATTAVARPAAGGQGAVPATTNVTYVVQYGDTLNKIAAKYCTTWQAIYNMNYAVIGPDPNHIHAGMVLTVPANCSPGTTPPPPPPPPPPSSGVYDRGPNAHANGSYYAPNYTVAAGDWLSYIGQRFGVPWQYIYSANHLYTTVIYPGQVLYIPGATGTPPPPTPTPSPSAERVYFAYGTTYATRTGTIANAVPKTYVLGARAGQTMYVSGASHAEALTVSIKDAYGQPLSVSGTNGAVNFNVQAYLPSTIDYYVTFTPVTPPSSPSLVFDVTFTIP
jgi:LysM repeat protein